MHEIDKLRFVEDNELEDGTILLEPWSTFCKAIDGITSDRCHVIYSYSKLIEALREDFMQDDLQYAEQQAYEWIDFNTLRALSYMDEKYRPIVMIDVI